MRDDGFAEFAEAEMPGLLRLARTLTGDPHDAADLVQDCLVRVGSRWGSIRSDQNPGGYARVVLVRLNVDRIRNLRRRLHVEQRAAQPPATAEPSLGVEPWVAAAWQGLTPNQRTALALRYFADLDLDEIAEAMSCSSGTVRSHLSRGLSRLRSQDGESVSGGQRR